MPETLPEPLLSIEEVARYLNVPVGTVRKWRATNSGPPGFRVGKHVRWRRETLERWVEQQQANSPLAS